MNHLKNDVRYIDAQCVTRLIVKMCSKTQSPFNACVFPVILTPSSNELISDSAQLHVAYELLQVCLRKMRPERTQVCNPPFCLPQNKADLKIISCQNVLPHGLFHFVSDLAIKRTVHSKSGLPILATYIHFNTVCAYRGASSPAPLRSSLTKT